MIIVYKEVKDGKIEFTKEEFEQYLEQARKDGYSEGYRDAETFYSRTIVTTNPNYEPPYYDSPYKFTCTGTNVVDTGSTKIHVE